MAGNFYWRLKDKSKVDEIAKLEPAVAGADKERDWIKAFWENFRNDINIAQDFLAKVNNNDLNPTSFEMKQHPKSTVRLGAGLPSDMASETNIVLPILKTVGSPPISISQGDDASNSEVSTCDVFVDPGHSASTHGEPLSDRDEAYKYPELKSGGSLGDIGKMFNVEGSRRNEPFEHILNVYIASMINTKLKSKGLKVFYYDENVKGELGKITGLKKFLKPGAIYLSIHHNADNFKSNDLSMKGTAHGTRIYHFSGGNSARLANALCNNLRAVLGKDNIADPKLSSAYPQTKNIPDYAAGVLIECAFYDNASDVRWIVQNADKYATAVVNAVMQVKGNN